MGVEGRGERLWFLDWLRVIAVFGVFVFHTLRPFDEGDWHVKNAQTSAGISIAIAFLGLWGLAFFFMVSALVLSVGFGSLLVGECAVG